MAVISQYKRWPSQWPAEFEMHVRWPGIMQEQASWPYQYKVERVLTGESWPEAHPKYAIATFQFFRNGIWVWTVQPSLVGPDSSTQLLQTISFKDDLPQNYVRGVSILSIGTPLWSTVTRDISWHIKCQQGLCPQNWPFDSRVEGVGVPGLTATFDYSIEKGCNVEWPPGP